MSLTEEQRLEFEKGLREAGLMEEGDVIEEHTAGDYYPMMQQTRGNYYFTRERLIFVSGWGATTLSVKYSDIREIKKSFVGPFLPFGVTVIADNQEKGKTKKYKLSLMKRTFWMDLIAKKAGITYQFKYLEILILWI